MDFGRFNIRLGSKTAQTAMFAHEMIDVLDFYAI